VDSAFLLRSPFFAAALIAAANPGPPNDPPLFAALRSDGQVRSCRCVLAARWLNESYPRLTVDAAAWAKLGGPARKALGIRALRIAEATYLVEFESADQYEEVYFYDRKGTLLMVYRP
jgi:hypothetical protein